MKYKIPHRNPLSDMTLEQKRDKYNIDVNNPQVRAYYSSGDSERLGKIPFENVEFIAGLWRVQDKFEKEIITVHRYAGQKDPKEFIILEKLNTSEPFPFNYYKAGAISWNCYGVIQNSHSHVLGESYGYWSYGDSIPNARAFLAQKLIAQHKDAFFKIISENQNSKQ